MQSAFREVHDALSANDTTREVLAAQRSARRSSSRRSSCRELRYTSGVFVVPRGARRAAQLLQAQTLQIIAARDVRLSIVDFAKALGGGWDYKTAVALP